MIAQINELKATANELIKNICARMQTVAECYQSGNDERANEKMVYLMEDIAVLVEAADLLKTNVSAVNIEECNEKLNMLFQAYQAKDYLLTADLLTFELHPLFEYWSENLTND
ncbi:MULTISPECIES: hypothetical protein [Paenibacillus]|uniref:Uncharacterized protein n=1 Tax=Paenibacillus naphthalenovorans TaxID=162209 RepID=A0A0U2WAK1_9BACL|nr:MULTISPECIES: hypothetical protein [Paenibacillus]ALS24477.1 hypothetical protein IJ22_41810 [Paenibacillus naphthalenovorans]GCL73680.1 hypothetical protein PN4B1_36210 [Paenibacillus naphthalenovorans]SDJ12684.1 hypothetical protein SAMN05421868_1184 [Paenibacillus naphthalenovorans]